MSLGLHMTPYPPLETFGPRIMIMGPTNAGKSTLAEAIARKLGIPAVHVDLLYHQPNTDWQPRPREEFVALHAAAIATPAWVMDGNYSAVIPERLARATGIIVLDDTLWIRIRRYLWRTLFQRRRIGALEGNRDSVKWTMIHWLWHTRDAARKYRAVAGANQLPHITVANQTELKRLYQTWGLALPDAPEH